MGTMMDAARLAAYVDGALEPEDAAQVVMHLADSPDDRRHVERLGDLNALLAAAYSGPMSEAVPRRIREIIDPPKVIPFPLARRRWPLAGAALAAAASVVLVVWIAGGDPDPLAGAPGVGQVPAGSELHAALEANPSGMVVNFPDGDEITLIATFRDGGDRPCREFELIHGGAAEFSRGIACRADAGTWSIAVVVSEPLGGEPDTGGAYMPASGATGGALSGALDALGAGPSLAPAAEAALIASGWRVN